MAVKFKEVALHGKNRFLPNHAYGFEDKDAEPFFIAAGWAEPTKDEPEYVFPLGEVDIDPATIHNDSGLLMSDVVKHGSPEKAQEAGAVRPNSAGALATHNVEASGATE